MVFRYSSGLDFVDEGLAANKRQRQASGHDQEAKASVLYGGVLMVSENLLPLSQGRTVLRY